MGPYFDALFEFVKKYPLQTAGVFVGVLAIVMNVHSTQKIVKSLQVRGGKR